MVENVESDIVVGEAMVGRDPGQDAVVIDLERARVEAEVARSAGEDVVIVEPVRVGVGDDVEQAARVVQSAGVPEDGLDVRGNVVHSVLGPMGHRTGLQHGEGRAEVQKGGRLGGLDRGPANRNVQVEVELGRVFGANVVQVRVELERVSDGKGVVLGEVVEPGVESSRVVGSRRVAVHLEHDVVVDEGVKRCCENVKVMMVDRRVVERFEGRGVDGSGEVARDPDRVPRLLDGLRHLGDEVIVPEGVPVVVSVAAKRSEAYERPPLVFGAAVLALYGHFADLVLSGGHLVAVHGDSTCRRPRLVVASSAAPRVPATLLVLLPIGRVLVVLVREVVLGGIERPKPPLAPVSVFVEVGPVRFRVEELGHVDRFGGPRPGHAC
mmetsp:Transcript_6751/g.20576  ORF Transcript_6751/g.20576 Transcript_6751/m.20576 type:complete len:381 (-) Transcript_6751:4-1146(-)